MFARDFRTEIIYTKNAQLSGEGLATKQIGFRASETSETKLRELLALYGFTSDNFSEDMRLFIDEIHKSLVVDKMSPDAQVTAETKRQTSEALSCINRIFHQNSHWCVNRPPKMVKLVTLEICGVCKKRRLGLPDYTPKGIQLPKETVSDKPAFDPDNPIDQLLLRAPDGIEQLLHFEDKGDYIQAKTKRYLPPNDFSRVASWVKSLRGDYISAKQDSHFRIPKLNGSQPSKT